MFMYALVTTFYSFKYDSSIQNGILEISKKLQKESKENMRTIEQLRRFQSYTSDKIFQFNFATFIPLTIQSLLGRATLVVTIITIARALFPLVVKQFYVQ
jgi:DUF4097 and DUF4098 domain-containing protein YvlB